MNTKFYVHHKEHYSLAGAFNTEEAAYEYLASGVFKKLVGLQNTTADDFVVDELAVDEGNACFLFYHVTATSNVESIFKNGLIPLLGERAIERGKDKGAIFAFPSLNHALAALEDWFAPYFFKYCVEKEGEEATINSTDFSVLTLVLPYALYAKYVHTNDEAERVINIPIPAECIDVAYNSAEE